MFSAQLIQLLICRYVYSYLHTLYPHVSLVTSIKLKVKKMFTWSSRYFTLHKNVFQYKFVFFEPYVFQDPKLCD
jgi:hypothetical protein